MAYVNHEVTHNDTWVIKNIDKKAIGIVKNNKYYIFIESMFKVGTFLSEKKKTLDIK